jgi:hypothetical protein
MKKPTWMIRFDEHEIEELQKMPVVLEELANYHEVQATMADAIGGYDHCVIHHESRGKELTAEAYALRAEFGMDQLGGR